LRAAGLGYNEIKGFGGSTQHVGYNVIIDASRTAAPTSSSRS